MKKILIIVAIVVIIAIIGVAILFSTKKGDVDVTINIIELANSLNEAPIFEDTLSIIDKEIILKNYDFNNDMIKDIISYVGSGATAEEILVLEVNNKEDLNEIKTKINDRLEERKINFQNYVPKEVYKLENCILETKGNYLIFCVSNDSDKATEIINQYIKK